MREPRMKQKVATILLNCFIFAAAQAGGASCSAQVSAPQTAEQSSAPDANASSSSQSQGPPAAPKTPEDQDTDRTNTLGAQFLKNLLTDQKTIWTSPAHLHWADGTWLFPFVAVTAGMFATDRAVPPALTTDQTKLNRYVSISNYGLYTMIGAGGGAYIWGKLSHNDHQRETGILASEAAIDSVAVNSVFKYAFERARPYQDQGLGDFFHGGTSFASDHSVISWSIASVIAHEYPGPLTEIGVYGLATAISATRVLGKQHFPSDVFVGAAMGWLIGRQVYRAHHDPEVGGGGWNNLPGTGEGEEDRQYRRMGSPIVPLDSWVYSAIERLASLQYVHSALLGTKPWTRMECARLTEEAQEGLQDYHPLNDVAAQLQERLAQEFAYEINLLGGGRNFAANLESVYARAVSISGPALTDSYHFGQTVSYDFGRPFERGTNGQAGGSFSADAGPLTLYIRAEYQHAPAAPPISEAARSAISQADLVNLSQVSSGPVPETNRLEFLDTYAAVNLDNWQLALGRQSISWAPSGDSMEWSNNIEPVDMVRVVNPEPFSIPGFLHFIGLIRTDQFFGRLEGHPYEPRPFIYGQKVSVKPFSFLELGFGRTVTIGGQGGDPLTGSNLLRSFVGIASPAINSVPGHNQTEMDWTFYVPGVRNYIVLYGDSTAPDDILPIENPARNPWHPGIALTRIPGLPKRDVPIEGVSTEQPGLAGLATYTGGPANKGEFDYWNFTYRDGYTNDGYLIGNTVGRDGRSIQAWLTYRLSATNRFEVYYKHNSVASEFIPGGRGMAGLCRSK